MYNECKMKYEHSWMNFIHEDDANDVSNEASDDVEHDVGNDVNNNDGDDVGHVIHDSKKVKLG